MATTRVEERLQGVLPPGQDPRAHALLLQRVRAAALSGARPPRAPRAVIGASWRRVRGRGVDPGVGGALPVLGAGELERRRAASGLVPLLPLLRARLLPAAEAAGQVLVVADPDGRVLWREGPPAARRRADALGFVEGSAWGEASVGTNAIGTSLVEGVPLHVHAGEHWVEDHGRWTCAAAPLHDPATGRLLGAVDVSGPVSSGHPSTLALVDAVARLVVLELQDARAARLDRLRAVAAPLLATRSGPALAVDLDGVVAATTGVAPERVLLPADLAPGAVHLPPLGACSVEPLPGGWLLLPGHTAEPAPLPVLTLALRPTGTPGAPAGSTASVCGPSGTWSCALTPRHTALVRALGRAPQGRSAAQLAGELFGDPARTVTVRAELSRLRRALGPLLLHQPYRLAARLVVRDDPDEHPSG